MPTQFSGLSPGAKLKKLRESLQLTLRQVQKKTQELAAKKKNPEYVISRGWLTEIENGEHVPSIFKVYSMSVVYCRSWSYLNSLFEVQTSDIGKDQATFGMAKTRLVDLSEDEAGEKVVLPLRFREDHRLDKTNLLSKLTAVWGDIPVALVRHLNPEKCLYGFVGLQDYTLFPLIRPGTFVQIDVNQRKIVPATSGVEFERPIYFLELRGGYACGWCELKKDVLTVLPHPNSGAERRHFHYPQEAEIVGRVTAVAMRIASDTGPRERRARKQRGR
jgi:transcriptional regulator with XRE-family HTH domain